jgi:hypothetical protein
MRTFDFVSQYIDPVYYLGIPSINKYYMIAGSPFGGWPKYEDGENQSNAYALRSSFKVELKERLG